MDKRMTYGVNGSHWAGCAEVHWDCRIATLETLGMLLWYEPVSRTYRVMRYEDELMEVVR